MKSKISIIDLEVFYRVGVTDQERTQAQRLLLTIEMTFDFSAAAASDELVDTIDYYSVAQVLLHFGEDRSWKLIERLAAELAEMLLVESKPQGVSVEVKKFVVPEARHVSVTVVR
jgi:dihydroneopterin aldolase